MKKSGRKEKFDYEGDDFYDEILALAMQGLTDAEIADSLEDRFGEKLSPERFSCMKNGKYEAWSEEENKIRSERMCKVLSRGRRKINAIVRGTYLKAAIGSKKVKSMTKRFVQDKCPCMGADKKCPDCGGSGWTILTDKAVIQETEQDLAPNMQALSTWLYHHDMEWRKVHDKESDDGDEEVDIDEAKWISNASN